MTQLATTRGIVLEDMAFFPTKTLSQLAFDDLVMHLQQMGDRWASLIPTHKISTLQDVTDRKNKSPFAPPPRPAQRGLDRQRRMG